MKDILNAVLHGMLESRVFVTITVVEVFQINHPISCYTHLESNVCKEPIILEFVNLSKLSM